MSDQLAVASMPAELAAETLEGWRKLWRAEFLDVDEPWPLDGPLLHGAEAVPRGLPAKRGLKKA